MRQIALPFPSDARHPSRIVVGTGNAHVIDALGEPARWPFRTALLSGPPRSGKSLLARWFVDAGMGDAVDDADRMDETALFHAWNRAQESGRPLLIVSALPYGNGAGRWQVVLPDLASRLGAALALEIGPPDDESMAALLGVQAEMRGLVLDESATTYLVGRVERSHLAAERLVAAIDRLSLERKQAPGIAIWRDALEEIMGPGKPE
ncbi:ATPase [Novosphingobium colocasiae]|uniref:ATPase n=1 Tax=Novosphingobium colocasiae TaxID=1256513 RepID=UPI0035AFC14A